MRKLLTIIIVLAAMTSTAQVSEQLIRDIQYAEYLVSNNRKPLAYEHLNNIIRTHKTCAEAYYLRALAYRADGNTKSAIRDLQNAMQYGPSTAKYHMENTSLMLQLKKYGQAYASLQKAMQCDSALTTESDHNKLVSAETMAINGATIDAIRIINTVDTRSGQYYRIKGIAYTKAGLNDEAIQTLGLAIDTDPKLTDCYIWRGMAHYQSGNTSKAHADWQTAIRKREYDARIYLEKYK